MMLFNAPPYDYSVDMQGDSSENFQMFLHSGLADTTILPIAEAHHLPSMMDSNYEPETLPGYGDEPHPPSYEEVEMLNDEGYYGSDVKNFANLFTISQEQEQISEWRTKNISDWSSRDTKMWILDTAASKKLKIVEIPSFQFSNVIGMELAKMTKEAFCDTMNPNGNFERLLIGEILYEELQNLLQEAVVPATVVDKFTKNQKYINEGENKLFDMDSSCNSALLDNLNSARPQGPHGLYDSGYDSLSDEYDLKLKQLEENSQHQENQMTEESGTATIVKRPPGRPKGSGKKLPKRIKNVSVPEFLRDLLLDKRYCPRIIKWEDYSAGKFRFVRANEVAELWGGKKNNPKMSFEKFSRAMRYHYKQEVLVSVPTARLVYQFGPKAPPFTTNNPNFESTSPPSRFNSR